MHSRELVDEINTALALQLPPTIDEEGLMSLLADHINFLITSDFQKLIFVLYRVDVNESKLTSLLQQHPGADAGKIIASLLIERQVEKIKSRARHRSTPPPESEEERW